MKQTTTDREICRIAMYKFLRHTQKLTAKIAWKFAREYYRG